MGASKYFNKSYISVDFLENLGLKLMVMSGSRVFHLQAEKQTVQKSVLDIHPNSFIQMCKLSTK